MLSVLRMTSPNYKINLIKLKVKLQRVGYKIYSIVPRKTDGMEIKDLVI
jgi:hypothetical protein